MHPPLQFCRTDIPFLGAALVSSANFVLSAVCLLLASMQIPQFWLGSLFSIISQSTLLDFRLLIPPLSYYMHCVLSIGLLGLQSTPKHPIPVTVLTYLRHLLENSANSISLSNTMSTLNRSKQTSKTKTKKYHIPDHFKTFLRTKTKK